MFVTFFINSVLTFLILVICIFTRECLLVVIFIYLDDKIVGSAADKILEEVIWSIHVDTTTRAFPVRI